MKSTRLCATLILFSMTAASIRLTAQANPPQATASPVTALAAPTTPGAPTATTATTATDSSGPILQLSNPTYDFGKAAMGEKVRHTYLVTNTGSEILHITKVQPGCHCTTVGDWTHDIAPGKGGEITVQFDSAGFGGGPVTKNISVYSNAKNEPRATLLLRGTVWKPIEVSPSTAIISIAPDVTNAVSTTVRIVNQTENPVTISNAVSANKLFTVASREVKPGKQYELIITAQPPFAAGSSWGTVTVNTSLPGTPTINVPVMASVVPPIQIYPQQIVLNLLPDRWTTNRVTIHSTTTNVLTLSNPKASDSRIHVEVLPMGPKGMFNVVVAFPPGFTLDLGQHAEVTVESDHPRYPVIKIPIVVYVRPKPMASWPPRPNLPKVPVNAVPAQPNPAPSATHQ
jgi:hypothetical protein